MPAEPFPFRLHRNGAPDSCLTRFLHANRDPLRWKTLWSRAGRRRRQEIAEPTHGLDDIDVELLADTANEHFDGVGIAIKILVVEMFDQFGARHHAPGMMHQI